MADLNYILEQEAKRTGANACMTALRKMETVAGLKSLEQTWAQHWQEKQEVTDILVKASGVTAAYDVGFLAALAEFVSMAHNAGIPNLDAGGWVPRAAMTEGEFAAYRHEMEQYNPDPEPCDKIQDALKVLNGFRMEVLSAFVAELVIAQEEETVTA